MEPKISVIVPVYNVEKYLECCINSIRQQTFTDFELILVNDGSSDNCGEMCNRYQQEDARVVVIHQENQGLSQARNNGIDICRGEYITFVDGDDYIHIDMLKTMWNYAKNDNADIVACDFQYVYENKKNTPISMVERQAIPLNSVEAVKTIIKDRKRNMIVAWGKLYRTTLFKDIRYPKGKLNEDEYVSYRLLYKASKTVVLNDKFYYYLQRTGSIMGKVYNTKRLQVLEAFVACVAEMKQTGNEELYHWAQHCYCLNLQIAYYYVDTCTKGNKHILENLRADFKKQYKALQAMNPKELSSSHWLLLNLFYYSPRLYCLFSNIYLKLGMNG